MPQPSFRRWGRKTVLAATLIGGLLALGACSSPPPPAPAEPAPVEQAVARDLTDIKAEGVLRLITRNNSTSYFFLRGEQFGFEYELAKGFAESQGLKLEVVTPASWDELVPFLNQGRGDIIGANYIGTPTRENKVAVSIPWYKEDLVVVGRDSDGEISDPLQLAGRTIYVQRISAAIEGLEQWGRMLSSGFKIEYLPDEMEKEDILRGVGTGKYDLTVVSRHIAELERTHTTNLAIGLEISRDLPIVWAVRHTSPELKAAVDDYIRSLRKSAHYNYLYKKYYVDPNRLRIQRQQYTFTLESGRLSPWDEAIKTLAMRYDFDWRFIAAVIYHESHFDPEVKSWAGAKGLMQLMPDTAKTLRMDCFSSDYANIHCGVRLLDRLRKLFRHVPEADRMKFVLAAYNAGLGHVRDAQHLAVDTAHNPLTWDNEVEKMIGRLAQRKYYRRVKHGYCNGPVVMSYVTDILSLYRTYSQLLPPNEPEVDLLTPDAGKQPAAVDSTSQLTETP